MADTFIELEASSPLNGYKQDFGTVSVEELAGKALVSIAKPLDIKTKLKTALKKTLGAEWPKVGKSTRSNKGYHLLGLQHDMIFALFDHPGGLADSHIKAGLKDNAYCTDQSDAWVVIQISGEGVYFALERICPINISSDAFDIGSVARTHMEHLGVMVIKQSKDTFLLVGASSSAEDLLHAIVVSVENTQ